MTTFPQLMIPGIIGISTYVDHVYHREMQLAAIRTTGTGGPINRLRTVTVTLDFHELLANVRTNRFDAAEEQVAEASRTLEAAGADFVVVTSGTTSTLTAQARRAVSLGFLDLAGASWDASGGADVVGLLSTRRAAAGGIFGAIAQRRGGSLLIPDRDVASRVDDVIFNELVHGRVTDHGVRTLRDAVTALATSGAEAVILGNTDMTLAVDQLREQTAVPLIDSARAHAQAAGRAALSGVGPGLPAVVAPLHDSP